MRTANRGPTQSGHRTPAVIVNLPVNGTDEATVRANAWMFHQVLATGVHGILLCHADTPGAVRAFVGPGDMAFSLGVKSGPGPMPAVMQAARAKVLAATKGAKIFFLNSVTPDDVVDMIKEGVMIGASGEQAAALGRAYTKRAMPW